MTVVGCSAAGRARISRESRIEPVPISWDIFRDILCFCSTIRISKIGFGYRIFRDFAANEWIRRPDIRIFRDFAANEWIRRPDIRMFRDFVTGILVRLGREIRH